ncbi:MAG TPA: dihydroneopterin aldolase [Chitinophagaceae bacterium]|nr:dihydroneopterin aldolase [Chitinophagaceae bacterium]
MVTVHLHQLIMHAFHGLYAGEDKTGNNYEINLDVTYEEGNSPFEAIHDTISYEELFGIVKKRMQAPTPLLEKVCESIIRSIRHQYPYVQEVAISMYKLQPPIENLQGKVGVTMRKTFDV